MDLALTLQQSSHGCQGQHEEEEEDRAGNARQEVQQELDNFRGSSGVLEERRLVAPQKHDHHQRAQEHETDTDTIWTAD